MKPTLTVDTFVIADGRSGYVTEIHAKAKTAKVILLGYYHIRTDIKVIDIYKVKNLRIVTQKEAWEVAPKFPGHDV